MGKTTERTEVANQESIRTLGEKENFKYSGIVDTDTIKQTEMIEKLRKEYLRRRRKDLETKFYNRNPIQRINNSVITLVGYSGSF